jgi:DnaJ-class molecular chaperone
MPHATQWQVLLDPQLRHVYDTSGKEGASQARGYSDVDPVEQTVMLCKALFGSGKFDTVFGDPTTFPLFVMAIKMMERSQTTGRELDATAEIKAQLDRDSMKDAEQKEKELVAELVVYLKKKVCKTWAGGQMAGVFLVKRGMTRSS